MTSPAPPTRTKRVLAAAALFILFGGMIALGLFSNRPAPPPTLADPQPLLHLYRHGHPAPLLDSLPLLSTDRIRLFAETPPDLKATFFCITADGQIQEYPAHFLQRVGITGLMFDQVAFPQEEKELMGVNGPAGTRVYLLCASRKEAPTKEWLQSLVEPGPLPAMPSLVMMRFTPTKIGPICSRGARLPEPAELKEIDERLAKFCHAWKGKVDFFAGVAVRVK